MSAKKPKILCHICKFDDNGECKANREKDWCVKILQNDYDDLNKKDKVIKKEKNAYEFMRQRAEEAERLCEVYRKAYNDAIGEILAKDEQDRIGHRIASLLSYTMIVQGLTNDMVNRQALWESVEEWREARKSVNPDDITTVQSYRSERDDALAKVKQAEEALRRCLQLADDGVDDPAGPYNVLAQIANTVATVLSSPPADASTMGTDHSEDNLNMVGERDNRTYNQLTPSEQFRLDKIERDKKRTGVHFLEDD